MFGVSGVRPSAVEQSASEAAGLQPGEKNLFIHSVNLNFQDVKSLKVCKLEEKKSRPLIKVFENRHK